MSRGLLLIKLYRNQMNLCSYYLLGLILLLCGVPDLCEGRKNVIETVLKSFYDGSFTNVRQDARFVLMGLCPLEQQYPKSLNYRILKRNKQFEVYGHVLRELKLLGLSMSLDDKKRELLVDWFIIEEEAADSYHPDITAQVIQTLLNSFDYSDVSLFVGQELVAKAKECWRGEAQIRDKIVFATHSCAFNLDNIDPSVQSVVLHSSAEQFDRMNWKLFMEVEGYSLREYISLCRIEETNALLEYYQPSLSLQDYQPNEETTILPRKRFFHTLVGCSRIFSNVDKLEKLWPGIIEQWIKHHVYYLSIGYISIYDGDGSAWKYVKSFVDLGFVRYHRKFLLSRNHNQGTTVEGKEMQDSNITSNETYMQIMIDNHCIWESKGRSEWVILLRDPSFFVSDHVAGGYNLYTALDQMNDQRIFAKLDRIQHSIRLLNKQSHENIFHAYPYVELGIPTQTTSIVDPHKISTLIDQDRTLNDNDIHDFGELEIYVNEYPFIFQNVTLQDTLLWSRDDITVGSNHSKVNDRLTVIDPNALSIFTLLQIDGEPFHKSLVEAFKKKKTKPSLKIDVNRNGDRSNQGANICEANSTYKFVFVGPGLMPIPPTGWGSVENIIWNYYLELSQRGHDVTILNTANGQEVIKEIKEMTNDEQGKIDVLHIQIETLTYIVDEVVGSARLILVTIHNAFFTSPSEWQDGYHRYLDGISITVRTHSHIYFFVVSPLHRDWLMMYWNIPADRIYTIPNGVEVSKFHLHFEENAVQDDMRRTAVQPEHHGKYNKSVSIGIIVRRKGQYYLQSILSEESIDFIGSQDSNHGNFNFSASNYLGEWTKEGLYHNLTFYDNLVHLASAEAAAPLVVLEAMAAGLGVVITTNASVNLDIFKPFISIIPDDKVRDAKFIREMILKNKIISRQYKREIRKYVEENFSWSHAIIPKYLQTIQQLRLKHCDADDSIEKREISFAWAKKYSLWRRFREHIGSNTEKQSPYLAVITLVENFTVVMVDWIEIMRTIGAQYFILFTIREHELMLRSLLHRYIEVEQIVEIHCVNDFPYYQRYYSTYDNINNNVTLKNQIRKRMFLDGGFQRQICNEALAMLRMIGTTWSMVLFEQDYIFEDLSRYSFITRNALSYYLRHEEEQSTDVVIIEGVLTQKMVLNVSYLENQTFVPYFASRCITYVPRTAHYSLFDVGCPSVEPCSIKTIYNKLGSDRPFYFMALGVDYLWQLPRYVNGNINSGSTIQYVEIELDKEAAIIVKDFLNHHPNLERLVDITMHRLNTIDICEKSPILLVSFYRDIGRGQWNSSYNRSSEQYLQYFANLVETTTYPVVLYTDEETINRLHDLLVSREEHWRKHRPDGIHLVFRNIDDVTSNYDRYLQLHEKIISCKEYQEMIPSSRRDKPEHIYATYTATTNSKIDYLAAARNEFQTCSYYAFIDFGYVRQKELAPLNIDIDKLLPNKIMLPSMTLPNLNKVLSRQELLKIDDIYIEGSTFIVPNGMVAYYHELWHEELTKYHAEHIVDDDQSIAYQIVMRNPHLFVLVRNGRWFQTYSTYLNSFAYPLVLDSFNT